LDELTITNYTQVPFETMLKCDGEIICDCWLLRNSLNKYGIDLTKPMLFNEFLRQIGTHLTPMNCKSLFGQGMWYVIDDGIQPNIFLTEDSNNKEDH
jgi:hypothetical protein